MARGNNVLYEKKEESGPNGAALETNHTHFVLVDDGKDQWGGEIAFRSKLEEEVATHFNIPIVVCVVDGVICIRSWND